MYVAKTITKKVLMKTLKRDLLINTYKFFNNGINKFDLLLRQDAYPYEYNDDWEKFNEISLPKKEDFESHLNMKIITDADYTHVKSVCKDFEIETFI